MILGYSSLLSDHIVFSSYVLIVANVFAANVSAISKQIQMTWFPGSTVNAIISPVKEMISYSCAVEVVRECVSVGTASVNVILMESSGLS